MSKHDVCIGDLASCPTRMCGGFCANMFATPCARAIVVSPAWSQEAMEYFPDAVWQRKCLVIQKAMMLSSSLKSAFLNSNLANLTESSNSTQGIGSHVRSFRGGLAILSERCGCSFSNVCIVSPHAIAASSGSWCASPCLMLSEPCSAARTASPPPSPGSV